MVKKEDYEQISDDEDYEVVPLTPLRRLEKRITSMESSKSFSNMERMMDKILDMVELNQRIVDEMVKANTSLRGDLATLIGKIDSLQGKLTNFIDIVEDAGKEDVDESEAVSALRGMVVPLVKSITDANEKLLKSNEVIAENLSIIDKRLKRSGGVVPSIGGQISQNPSPYQMQQQAVPQQNNPYGGV
ncbi:MAG: hypothetical protein K0B07_00500 [DPANN group archaeon]|nr:hypothetical protein [DPANN group archaeon]